MTAQEVKPKLVAILSADVKGYSRLMGEDEEWTVHTLNTYKDMMRGLIQQHRGRVVDAPGDNVLAEFGSVVDAVECAVEIQNELKTRNDELPENRKMEFRIGVNLGDVIVDGDSMYGDGVNIAARVESLADAGGICISGTTFDQVKDKLNLGYKYIGEQTVKNILEPVGVYRVLMEPEADTNVIVEKKAKSRQWFANKEGPVVTYDHRDSKRETFFEDKNVVYDRSGTESWILFEDKQRSVTREPLHTIAVRRKGRIEYFDPMELHTEYPLKIALLREMKQKSTTFKGVTIKWGDIGFMAKEENPEVEIIPKSTFFLFSPPERIAVIKADKDVFTDFRMRPLLLTQSTKVEIEFLYKRERIGLIGIDVKIQDKLKIFGGIRLSHDKWRRVISIATALATIGVFLDISRNLFESWKHIWLGSLGYVLMAASIPPFFLGTFLGAKGSRRRSIDF